MTTALNFSDLSVGDEIPDLQLPAINQDQLIQFADASGDHNPIHLDEEQAKKGGLPGIIAHGMLNMASLGLVLTNWVSQEDVRKFNARFVAMAYPGDVITCKGRIAELESQDGAQLVQLDLAAVNQKGENILTGSAQIELA
jgi:acyl dehydratase